MPLKESFRILYSLAIKPLDRVVDSYDGVGNIWVPRLRRNLNDWEIREVTRLFRLLEGIRSNPS